jgi:4-amino-4-deoxy-L-arabinose transferase-like glycosyltransferase
VSRRHRWGMVLILGIVGYAIRGYLLGTKFGELNADEAFTGLQALEIARGDLPIVYRGIGYTGIIDSYVFAPFTMLFGARVVPLKLMTSLWWILSSMVMFHVVRSMRPDAGSEHPQRWAWLAAGMMWLTPGAMMVVSIRAWEAYGLLLLATFFSAFMARRVVVGEASDRRDVLLTGAALGVAFYLHPMTLASVIPIALVPCWKFRRRLRDWWVPAVGAAIFVNVPFLAWNVKNDWLSLSQPSPPMNSTWDRLSDFFTGLLSRAFGLMNTDGGWVWGPASMIIYVLLMVAVVHGVLVLARKVPGGLVLALPAVLCWPILSLFNNMWFVDDGRYSSVGFPFLIVAIVTSLADLASRNAPRFDRLAVFAGALVAWVVVLVVPWIAANAGPRVDDPNERVRVLVNELEDEGFEYAAGNYWLMNPIEYQSDQRIHVAVAGHPWGAIFPWRPKLPWGVSFATRQAEVLSQNPLDVAYVFLAGDEQVGAMPLPVEQYERREVMGAVMYLPLVPE